MQKDVIKSVIGKKYKVERVNKTGFKGVRKVNHDNCYQPVITLSITGKQVQKTLGTYKTAEEAYIARINYLKKLM